MKRAPLATMRGIWRDQIFADHDLPSNARIVGYAIGGLITMSETAALYRRIGKVKVWPSQKLMCALTGLSVDTIRVSVAALIKGGHLKLLKRGNQVTGSSRYRILFKENA